MNETRGYRLGFWRGIFYVIVSLGLVLTVFRMVKGLGAVTNLSDQYPWGLWKAFNVLAGIGLGGAGFTIMGTVYVFNAKRFKPIVRPTLIMAFLAYASAAFALFVDIGRSWTIWHPIVMWNPHSVLFDVAWCLMLYTTVLLLEGSGIVFERLGWDRLAKLQHAITLPIVIVGVILSTLHQSSLGGLFVIVPGKLHPLWYSTTLPVLFFISAIGMGLAMIIVLSQLSKRAFGRSFDTPMLTELSRFLIAVLGVYFVARLFDLSAQGALPYAFSLSYEALLFHTEFLLGVVAPMILLAFPKMRANSRTLYGASLLVVFGFVANRLNVSITGFEAAQGGHYIPSWSEVFISLGVVAGVFGAYSLAVRFLPVYPGRDGTGEPEPLVPSSRLTARKPAAPTGPGRHLVSR